MKAGDLVRHRSRNGFGVVFDIDGLRHNLPVVQVMWCDRGCKYESANELELINESR